MLAHSPSPMAQTPHPNTTSATSSSPSAQRIKKREIDRRCQRLARQRTKSRLANLEALVEEFQSRDESGRISSLMVQINELSADKENLLKTLRTIQGALESTLGKDDKENARDRIATDGQDRAFSATAQSRCDASQTPQPRDWSNTPRDRPSSFIDAPDVSSPTVSMMDQKLPVATLIPIDPPLPPPSQGSPTYTEDTINLSDTSSHDISPLTGNKMDRKDAPLFQPTEACTQCASTRNIWRFTNDVLTKRPTFNKRVVQLEDQLNEEVPILAVLHGWDHVARIGKLTPAWEHISRVDRVIWEGQLPSMERMAVLRTVHMLMMYHIDPTPHRVARLPSWYFLRPSQTLAHAYAADYFAWPGVRERFVFHEHRYCTNTFWSLFNSNLRILWPFALRDCYTHHVATGQLQFSLAFRERLKEIGSWAMGNDMFVRWPELRSDIPAWNSIPGRVEGVGVVVVEEEDDRNSNQEGKRWHVEGERIGEGHDGQVVPFHQYPLSSLPVGLPRPSTTGYGGGLSVEELINLERGLREYA